MPDYTLRIIVDGEDRASGPIGGATSALGNLASVAGGFLAAQVFEKIAGGAVEFGKSVVESASEAEDALALFTNVVSRTGDKTGVTVEQGVALAKSFQMTTKFSDEQVLGAEKIIATFDHISGQTFPLVTQTALDMSTVLGVDSANAARMLGRALDMPAEGLNVLGRMGIKFTDDQKKMIKQMVETGDTAGAQAYMLDAIQSRIGGSAEAMGNTFSGVAARIGHQWDEIKETLGTPALSFLAVQGEKLMPVLSSLVEAAKPFIDGLLARMPGILAQVETFLAPVIDGAKNLFAAFSEKSPAAQASLQKFVAWFTEAMGPVLKQIVANVGQILNTLAAFWRAHGEQIMDRLQFAFRFVVATIMGALTLATGIIDAFLALTQGDWSGAWKAITDTLKTFMNLALSIVGSDLDSFLETWRKNWEMAKVIVHAIWDGIVNGVKDSIGRLIDTTLGGLKELWDKAKKFLGISSPSTLFAELGGNMMAGMAQGITRGQAMPAMAVAGAAQALAGAGSSVVHNYYLQAHYGYQDERSLAGDVRMLQFLRG